MSQHLELVHGLYAQPSPLGAFRAAEGTEHDAVSQLLRVLLLHPTTPRLAADTLARWFASTPDDALRVVQAAQDHALVEGITAPRTISGGSLEQVLPALLPALSSEGRALLVDAQGFVAGASGFAPEAAEALAALSADLGILHERHRRHFPTSIGLPTSAWALVDGAGNSEVGFWPLHIGDEHFVLTIVGIPRLHQQAFTDLIWVLMLRYGAPTRVPVAPVAAAAPAPTTPAVTNIPSPPVATASGLTVRPSTNRLEGAHP